jgi:zinc D-Ala-D-Ala carboxypeptidase
MSVRTQLSNNFYLDEFTASETATRHGINMSLSDGCEIHLNLTHLTKSILQPLRDAEGRISITSGYRPPDLSWLVGSTASSAHCFGRAADITSPLIPPLKLAEWIAKNCPDFDQLIHEHGRWVHVATAAKGSTPRRQLLTAVKHPRTGKTVYVEGLLAVSAAVKLLT